MPHVWYSHPKPLRRDCDGRRDDDLRSVTRWVPLPAAGIGALWGGRGGRGWLSYLLDPASAAARTPERRLKGGLGLLWAPVWGSPFRVAQAVAGLGRAACGPLHTSQRYRASGMVLSKRTSILNGWSHWGL